MRSEAQMDAAIAKAMTSLDESERQFRLYATHHLAKRDLAKAAVNDDYAFRCREALESLREVYNKPWRRP